MKKLLLLSIAVFAISAMAAETITIGSTVDATIEIKASGEYLLQGDGSVCTQQIIVSADLGEVSLTLDNVQVEVTGSKDAGVSALVVNTGTTATIYFKGYNTLKSTADPGCGIEALGNIVLNGEDDATLACYAKGWAAAIGSTPRPKGKTMASGDITINSGIIEAIADWESPGIGAAVDCDAHNIVINGGRITAKGGAQGAGIGTGYSQWGQSKGNGTITINGGTVVAAAGSNESDWGPDNSLVPLGVVAGTDATVKVEINGGSIHATRSDLSTFPSDIAAVDKSGTDLFLLTPQLENTTAPTLITKGKVGDIVLGEGGYGLNDVYTDAQGYIYIYLPKQADDVKMWLNTESTALDDFNNEVRIEVNNGMLRVDNAQGKKIAVYDISGRQTAATVAQQSAEIALPKGLYIVSVDGQCSKVVVK